MDLIRTGFVLLFGQVFLQETRLVVCPGSFSLSQSARRETSLALVDTTDHADDPAPAGYEEYPVKTLLLCLVLALTVAATPAAAGDFILMDYTGFGFETGGVPVSQPGDILAITAVAVSYDPMFGVAPGSQEVTIFIYDLVSTGEIAIGADTFISYVGGKIEVYEDPILDHDWATFPPNAQQSTFTNGALLFEGDFTEFGLQLTSSGFGVYEGTIDGVGGTSAAICDGLPDCAYTFGGAFQREIAQVPDGYDLQIDGTLEVDAAVPATVSSFGAVKSLFGN
jgi:hypothetical protein